MAPDDLTIANLEGIPFPLLINLPTPEYFMSRRVFPRLGVPEYPLMGIYRVQSYIYIYVDMYICIYVHMGLKVSQNREDLFGGPHNKDNKILGSISGSRIRKIYHILLQA